jgi:hypothetical protein
MPNKPQTPRPPEPQRPPGPTPPPSGREPILLDEYVDDPWQREHNAALNEANDTVGAIRERCYRAGYRPVVHNAA